MSTNRLWLLTALLVAAPWAARADDDDDDDDEVEEAPRVVVRREPAADAPAAKLYRAECGSCHLAFPRWLLPARSWSAILANLDQHFGANAEVDAATRAALEPYLRAEARTDAPGPAPLRITEQRWWRHEHDELPPGVYARPSIGTPAHCAACHPGAESGAFHERAVRIPR